MPTGTLIVAHGDGDSARWESLVSSIIEHWPAGFERPVVRTVGHGSLALERSLAQHATLVVGDASLKGARLTQLLDMLDGRCVPALVLLENGAVDVAAGAPGIVVWGADADPA